ncbi:MAG: ATP-binding protein [Bacteroidota bacterium]|jgi:hypothetical protein
MRRIRKPKLFDFESDESINLYDTFQSAYKEMTALSLSPADISKLVHTKHLSDILHVPITEIAALVVIVNRHEIKNMVSEVEVVNFLRTVLCLKPNEIRLAMKELKKMGLIVNFKDNATIYFYPARNVAEAIDGNSVGYFKNLQPKGLERLLDYWASTILDSTHITMDEIETAIEDIMDNNTNLTLVKYMKPLSKFRTFHEQSTVLSICCNALFNGRPFSLEIWERRSCFSRFQLASMREEIHSSSWKPMVDGYVRYAGGGYIQDNINLELTEKGYSYFFKDMDAQVLKVMRRKTRHTSLPITPHKSIKPIDLYFNDDFQDELDVLEQLLYPKTFKRYQQEISKNSRMSGLTFLLHGSAGTGKTELVYNLAKKTKRDIVKIQVTDITSKWVGQSEQNLMRVFTDYRLLLENGSPAPILFLNECDQLINKRVNIKGSVDTMSNALQNIFLEQMETFPGILIGTTNLSKNMDSAFERRWTYKIAFEKPNRSTQGRIWKSHLPDFSMEAIETLIQQYDFSPAEINNVIRRFQVNQLLFPKQNDIRTLLKMCKNETFQDQTSKSIGFGI